MLDNAGKIGAFLHCRDVNIILHFLLHVSAYDKVNEASAA